MILYKIFEITIEFSAIVIIFSPAVLIVALIITVILAMREYFIG